MAVLLTACAPSPDREYDNNDLELVTRYAAKELCSCLFVMQRDQGYCGEWTRASPNLRTYRVDWANRRVETQAVLYWGASARYVSARRGCVLE